MRWVEALRIWNAKSGGTWCIPRKGSPEYDAVKKIMGPTKKEMTKAAVKVAKAVKEAAPKADTRPYAKAPGVASAIEKLRQVERETKERNRARKPDNPGAAGAAADNYSPMPDIEAIDGDLYAREGPNLYIYDFMSNGPGEYRGRYIPESKTADGYPGIDMSAPEIPRTSSKWAY